MFFGFSALQDIEILAKFPNKHKIYLYKFRQSEAKLYPEYAYKAIFGLTDGI